MLGALLASNVRAAGYLPQRFLSQKEEGPSGPVGQESPAFVLPDLKGRLFNSKDLRNHYVLLDFWATWCPPCRHSIPELIRLDADYRSRGLKIVGINLDESKSDVSPFVQRFKIPYTVLLGGGTDVMDRFGIHGLPSFFLLGPDGKVIGAGEGYGEDLPDLWRRLLNKSL